MLKRSKIKEKYEKECKRRKRNVEITEKNVEGCRRDFVE